jgi:hypothetical protein
MTSTRIALIRLPPGSVKAAATEEFVEFPAIDAARKMDPSLASLCIKLHIDFVEPIGRVRADPETAAIVDTDLFLNDGI